MIPLMEMALVIELMSGHTDARVSLEQKCLIENAIYEAADQGPKGMALATEVALNRLEAGYRYKDTSCTIIHDHKQFSWTSTPVKERRKYTLEEERAAAQVVYTYLYENPKRMLPKNTLHYLNTRTATDMSWYDPKKVVLTYGGHTFLKDIK